MGNAHYRKFAQAAETFKDSSTAWQSRNQRAERLRLRLRLRGEGEEGWIGLALSGAQQEHA